MSEDKTLEALGKLISALNRTKYGYIIVGGAALAIHLDDFSYFQENGDIDVILFSERDWRVAWELCRQEGFGEKQTGIAYPGTKIKIDFTPFVQSVAKEFWQNYDKSELKTFHGLKIRVRPARLLRADYLRILGERRMRLNTKDIEAGHLDVFLKALRKLGLISAYKEKLGLAKKRNK